jgi:hypothetical protein
MDIDTILREQAEQQRGLLTRAQFRAAGATRHMIRHRLATPDWEAVSDRVIRLTGAPQTQEQRATAAVLDAGPLAWLSHEAAAAWWGLPGYSLDRLKVVDVARPRGDRRVPVTLGRVHEVLDSLPHHVKVHNGLRVVAPAVLIYELAGKYHPLRLARVCDNAWSRRLFDGRTLHRAFDDLQDRGRPGTQKMRELLAVRGVDYVPPASGVEGRFAEILADHGERPMRRQVDSGGQTWTGRVDFRDFDYPLIVEINSDMYHRSLCDQAEDEARYAALREAGFTVLVVWDTDVFHRPATVVAEVRAARRALSLSNLRRKSVS